MKKITLYFIGIIFSVNGFSQVTFHSAYGGSAEDRGYAVRQTSDGGYILAGFALSFGAGDKDIYVIKTDAGGNTLWTKVFGGAGEDMANDVRQTSDGGYIIAGYTYSFGQGLTDACLIKTDAAGDTLWVRTYGGTNYDFIYRVVQTSDGGYIAVGGTQSFPAQSTSYTWIIKTNSSGNVVWSKTYVNSSSAFGWTIKQTSDGGYIFAGYQSVTPILIKVNSLGDTLWTRKFTATGFASSGSDVIQTADGGYLLGTTSWLGAGSNDICLIKTNPSGGTVWPRLYGGIYYDIVNSVEQTTDGGYLACGITHSYGGGGFSDAYLVKINSGGDTLWTKRYGSFYLDGGYATAAQTTDGGFIIGTTNGYGAGGNYDAYLIKIDAQNNSGCRENQIPTTVSHPPIPVSAFSVTATSVSVTAQSTLMEINVGNIDTIFCSSFPTAISAETNIYENNISLTPNPATTELIIINNHSSIINIEIFNTLGEKVYSNAEGFQINAETINITALSSGIYFVRVKTSEGEIVGAAKFVKQ